MLKVATALPNEPYREYKDVERVYSGSTEIDKILDKNGNVLFAVNKEVEGTPALTYKGKEETNLKNYRIYGNTVNGENVGDLITEGEHAGEYKVPVTVEGKNLLSPNIDWFRNNEGDPSYHDGGSTVRIKTDLIPINDNKSKLIISGLPSDINFITYRYYSDSTSTEQMSNNNTGIIPLGAKYVSVLLGGTGINDETKTLLQNSPIQLEYGYTATPYEPYQTPITTNIYLPEPIKMVGDEAEYIDYAEQKQHRVRKNLLQNTATSLTVNGVTFTLNSDGSVTCNGTASDIALFVISSKAFSLPVGRYKLNGAPTGGGQNYNFKMDVRVSTNKYYADTGNGGQFSILQGEPIALCRIVIYSGYTCDNLTFYPMVRKADIEDDTYEPYIEDTELDVTLPALPTLSGTNTLTVGTEVQPSNVYLKGRIKEIT